mgnify:CR=1 FL=1
MSSNFFKDNDDLKYYFERGIETAIATDGLRVRPLDISQYSAVEVDFETDLARANSLFPSLGNTVADVG